MVFGSWYKDALLDTVRQQHTDRLVFPERRLDGFKKGANGCKRVPKDADTAVVIWF